MATYRQMPAYADLVSALTQFSGGFAYWLDQEIKRQNPDNIVFCSREGWYLGKCWEKVTTDIEMRKRARYIRISRRSMALSMSGNLEQLKRQLAAPSADCSLKQFIKERFGYTLETSDQSLIEKSGFSSAEAIINRRSHLNELTQLAEGLKDKLQPIFNRQQDLAKSYYVKFGLDEGRSMLVDIGYNGTAQRYLSTLFPKVSFIGRYVATFTGIRGLTEQKSWLLASANNRSKRHPITRNIPLFEFIMMTQDGPLTQFEGTMEHPKTVLGQPLETHVQHFLHELHDDVLSALSYNDQSLRMGQACAHKLLTMIDRPNRDLVCLLGSFYIDDIYGGKEERWLIPEPLPLPNAHIDEIHTYLQSASWFGGAWYRLTENMHKTQKILLKARIAIYRGQKRWARAKRTRQRANY